MRWILRPDNPGPLSELLTWIASRDVTKTWEVIAQEYNSTRSREQNAYLWGVVYPTIQKAIRDSRGEYYSTDEIHEWFRDKFLPKRLITIKGEQKVVRPSTARLKVAPFGEYLERIIHFCAESGIHIPPAEGSTT